MIISASYKTDIPAFYSEWFMNRLRAGSCKMVNPYGGQIYTINLTREAVDGIVFWTKNVGPLMKHLPEVGERGYPFIVQHTINGYPHELEARVVDPTRAIKCMRQLAEQYGPRVAIWRYDPIFSTSLTPLDWHKANFERLAEALAGATDEAVFSFAQVYQKMARNTEAAACEHGFTWREHAATELEQRLALVRYLAEVARHYGMQLKACSQPEYVIPGVVGVAKCVEAARLAEIAGRPLKDAPQKGTRQHCVCSASKDIGEYDTCPHGCVYCYAVQDRSRALARYKRHDPNSPFLFAPPPERQTSGVRQLPLLQVE